MKRMIISIIVEEKEVTELSEKISELVKEKTGKIDIQVSDASSQGSGATLAGVL